MDHFEQQGSLYYYKGKSFYYGAGDGSTVVARADNKK